MSIFGPEFIEALSLLAQACDDLAGRGYDRPVLVLEALLLSFIQAALLFQVEQAN